MASLQTTVILLAVFVSVNSASQKAKFAFLTHNEKTHQYELHEDEDFSSSVPWVIKGNFLNQMNETGWSYLSLTSNGSFPDKIQAYGAGYVEGALTREEITQHWMNTRDGYCPEPYNPYCQRLHAFLQENLDWMKKMIKDNAGTDPYWHMVEMLLYQVSGITDGYFNVSFGKSGINLDPFGLFMLQIDGDLKDLEPALGCEDDKKSDVFGSGSCSVLIKLLPGFRDLYVAHNTWSSYKTMLRVLKKYDLAFHATQKRKGLVSGRVITFSSYPGSLYSGDDYYLISSGLASLETTISNSNSYLWQFVQPTHVLEGIRTMVANRLAKTGTDWAEIFSQSNSGTYNNQWMIVNYNQFKPGIAPNPGLLTVLEQMPGIIVHEDKTPLLLNQTYWPSYNRAYFKVIFNISGQQENVAKYGDYFTYEMAPRAQIFRRDHGKVVDIESLTRLMRYNDFKHDLLSWCNCTPPYSAANAISARGDLNPVNGTYPLSVLGSRPNGGIDLKLTSSTLIRELKFMAIAGPTWDDLPPFQWSTSDFKDIPHHGIPDLCKFEPIYFNGTVLDKTMKVLFNL
ncbi:hypothetical protein CHS0354_032843 [Potamilus streckersoni]|uniref:Phospholipase B-like n=1 Tax=Potamilus streckersoni TaxID=2493646 RepID=A0AAE0SA68_9BIVA|nr:hypothetical protein CHS0354_032843 [Potamilus streckersoni]